MCGRFFVAIDDPEIMAILKEIEAEKKRGTLGLPPLKTGDIYPTDYAAAITATRESKPMYQQMRWGFSAYDGKGVLINARAETVTEKPTFRKPVAENRCLIPATYYYEWMKSPTLKKKIRHVMRDPKTTTVYMAGIYRLEASEDTPRFVILTKRAAKQIQDIHDRMPVILDREQQKEWLSPNADVHRVIEQSIDRIEGLEDIDDT